MDKVLSHLAGNMGKDNVTILQFYFEHCVRESLNDYSVLLNCCLFRH